MPAGLLRTAVIALVAASLSDAGLAAGSHRSRHRPATDRIPGAERLSPPRTPDLDTPGQTTVLTRERLDDMNATTLGDALRSTAGVTVGR
jgi:outer membrane receptor for monomeric catechols